MQPSADFGKLRSQDTGQGTPEAESPVTKPNSPGGKADQEAIARASQIGINPLHTESMSRAEDDAALRKSSPEFNDRPGQGKKNT
jgi:hypothetical protein